MTRLRWCRPLLVRAWVVWHGGNVHVQAMLWEDEPGYFTPTRGLLSYAPSVRRDLIRPVRQMDVSSHMLLVQLQLTQVITYPAGFCRELAAGRHPVSRASLVRSRSGAGPRATLSRVRLARNRPQLTASAARPSPQTPSRC